MRKVTVLVLFAVLCGAALFIGPAQSSSNAAVFAERINGTVVGISGRLAGRSRPFSLIINSYTPANQVRELNEALGRDGQDGLLNALSKMDAGRIIVGTGVGVSANAIIADPWGEGGRRIVVFYERNLSFFELRYGSRSEMYRVGYAELYLDRSGRGEGTLIPAARVRLRDGNTWEVEDFGVFPARILGLRASGSVEIR
ncbi:MAG TPA: hypothetical protein VFR78_13625 [Pyrinomonadaceae bacterium]|nr:hypothetical protein [Pyrinomonadaceae bacterium]